jgi:hypothetical protein
MEFQTTVDNLNYSDNEIEVMSVGDSEDQLSVQSVNEGQDISKDSIRLRRPKCARWVAR